MSKQTKEIVEPSIVVFGFLLQEAILDGWRISEQYPVTFLGNLHIVTVERDEDAVVAKEDTIVSVEETQETTPKKTAGRPTKAK